jgi:hypothetical protein
MPGHGWLTTDGRYHPLQEGESHGRAAYRLGLATEEEIEKLATTPAQKAMKDGNVRVAGDIPLVFAAFQDDPKTRKIIADFIRSRRGNRTVILEFIAPHIYEYVTRDQAIHWMETGKQPVKINTEKWHEMIASSETDLYHCTRYENAANILKHNYFRPSKGQDGISGLSTTTNPNYWWGSHEVRFVLDAKKLAQLYELKPVQETIYTTGHELLNESEILVVSDTAIMNALDYVKRIDYTPDTSKYHEDKEFLELAEQRGIKPVLLADKTASHKQTPNRDENFVEETNGYVTQPERVKGTQSFVPLEFMMPEEFGEVKTSADDLAKVNDIVTEYMSVLQPGLPRPKITFANSMRADWLGQTGWRFGEKEGKNWSDETTTITLQRRILGDEKTLRRVIAHELCHHEELLTHDKEKLDEVGFRTYNMLRNLGGAHRPTWFEIAARFNAKYGPNFVTEKSDENYVENPEMIREYFLLLNRQENGKIYYQTSYRLMPRQQQWLAAHDTENYRIVRSRNPSFTQGPTIGSGRWMYVKSYDTIRQEELETLWNEGVHAVN